MNIEQSKFDVATAKMNGVSTIQPAAENCRAIVLAGGNDYSSVSGLVPAGLRGQRPSHFCRTPGSEIVINRARKQIENLFSPQNMTFVVTEDHERYYKEVLPDVKAENLIVQPQDDGTTTAILYAALRIAVTNPSAILAIFPADFHTADSAEFMRRVHLACAFARRDPHLILLGVKSDEAETENDLIELDPSAPVDKNFGVWRVRRFVSGATNEQKRGMLKKGALVNSSVMVGTPSTFLRKIRRAAPDVWERFSLAAERIGTKSEHRAVRAAYYSQYAYTVFSRDVLEKSAEKLLVAPVPASLKSAVGVESLAAVSRVSDVTLVNAQPLVFAAGFGA